MEQKTSAAFKFINKDCNMTAGLEQVLNPDVGGCSCRNINTEYNLVN